MTQDTTSDATLAVINHFNLVVNAHDVDMLMSLFTDDCVFENTAPFPDGTHYEGQAAVRAFWESFFADSPNARFETEDIFARGDRGAVRWRYSWGDGHIRGVDIFTVRGGKVAEKLSYVKG